VIVAVSGSAACRWREPATPSACSARSSEALITYNPDLVWDLALDGFVRRGTGAYSELHGIRA
jgi:hypothetical protein